MTRQLTRTGQQEVSVREAAFSGLLLLGALERAWSAIRARHLEVPAVVLVVASGTSGGAPRWGHFAASRWQHGADRLPEVLVGGEGLQRPVGQVFTTLLHEAVHGLAHARGIQDTSRQGRWHNRRFAVLAGELGLDTVKDDKLGWSPCTLRETTEAHYTGVLVDLEAALSVYRHPEIAASGKARKSNNPLACSCGCPRRIRVAKAVLDSGAITCSVCEQDFTPGAPDTDEPGEPA